MMTPFVAAVPAFVRRPVKQAIRSFGTATSTLRCLPDFLIIGAHRSGTTSLYSALAEHPCVLPNFPRLQNIKGVRYFDQHFASGTAWYRSHFPTAACRSTAGRLRGGPILIGEASPYYLFHPLAADRAAAVLPNARLIALLRDPIDRAYSHWRRERRDGSEPLPTFEAALAAEPARLAGEEERIVADARYYSYAHENWSYVTQSLYLTPLRRWLDRFPRDQVLIESSERFLADPQGVYDRVLAFLGLPPRRLRDTRPLNAVPADVPLPDHVRAELRDRLTVHNRQLERYLSIEFGWDRRRDAAPRQPLEGRR
jgi:hypothetical protein